MGKKRGATAPPGKGGGAKAQQQQKKGGFLAGPRKFVRDVRGELRRVSWPGREQLRQSTAVVLIIVLTLAAYVAVWDFLFGRLARLIFT
ncbi:MAG: preprotein translocase subunit SecE [Actinomycetota bacterium]|nr:preprotein translocase subunit SecE [Actinomycetota bacterium]MDQ3375621.1 preprotein translocase subunit SecE [Actinomycetota bacterium]